MPPDEESEEQSSPLYDKIISVVYVVAIGFYLYMYFDTATDGELSRRIGTFTRQQTQRVRDTIEKRREYERSVGRMWWQIFTIREEEGTI